MPPKPPPSDSAAPSKKAPKNPKPEVASIDDLVLPRSLVTRLAKSVLPPNAAIQKQALLALSQGSTVFVNFLCSAANDIARREGRKALSAADILKAINQLEFGDFAPRLEAELALFTRVENGKKSRKGKAKETDSTKATTTTTIIEEQNAEQKTDGSTPITKKPRIASEEHLSPSQPENRDDTDSEAEEAEDLSVSDDEVVVSDEELEEEEVEEGLENVELDRELDERDSAEEDDALDDWDVSD